MVHKSCVEDLVRTLLAEGWIFSNKAGVGITDGRMFLSLDKAPDDLIGIEDAGGNIAYFYVEEVTITSYDEYESSFTVRRK